MGAMKNLAIEQAEREFEQQMQEGLEIFGREIDREFELDREQAEIEENERILSELQAEEAEEDFFRDSCEQHDRESAYERSCLDEYFTPEPVEL